MSKGNGNNRISALKRLGKSPSINTINRRQMMESNSSSVNDARQLLVDRNSSAFDARQLLNRQSSNTFNTGPTNIIIRKNLLANTNETDNDGKMFVVTGLKDMKLKDGRLMSTPAIDSSRLEKNKKVFAAGPSTFVTIRNNNSSNNVNVSSNPSTAKISLTKTITNTTVRRENEDRRPQTVDTASLSNHKVVISFVNDQYQKTPKPPQIATTPIASSPLLLSHHRDSPPLIKRLHDASIQTTSPSSSSRSPIRMSSHRRPPPPPTSEITEHDHFTNRTIEDDLYEPPVKRTTAITRKPATTTTDKGQQFLSTVAPTGSMKRTLAGTPVVSKPTSSISIVPKPIPISQSQSTPGTILVTNLVSSVTEEDVIELFGQIGRINEITTLSPGCVQIIYAKREYGEQAVAKYHNRLLDGQFMYVSLQQTPPPPPPPPAHPVNHNSKTTPSIQQPTKDNGTPINSSTTTTTNQPLKLNSTSNTSSKISIDPAFIRQALFHPTNNTANPVQFQVKL